MLNEYGNGFGAQSPVTTSHKQGFAYVFLPPGIEADTYRQHCINNGTVSIMIMGSIGFVSGVQVPKNCIELIDFPQSTEQAGSMVFFNTVPSTGHPVILNVYERPDNVEIKYTGKGAYLNKNGKLSGLLISDDGDVTLTSDGDGSITIRSTGGGDFEINSSDSIGISALNKITIGSQSISIRCTDEEGRETNFEMDKDLAKLSDSDGNEVALSKDGVIINSNSVGEFSSSGAMNLKSKDVLSLNEGTSPAVLGDKLLTTLQELVGQLQLLNTTTGAVVGTLLPPSAPPYAQIAVQLTKIQSEMNLFSSKTVLLS